MPTKKTIAILGTETIGKTIAAALCTSHRILLFERDFQKAKALEEEIKQHCAEADVEAMDCAHEASWEADVIIPAVPQEEEAAICERIQDVVTRKIVINIHSAEHQNQLQQSLPHARVVHVAHENHSETARIIKELVSADFDSASSLQFN
ncbi:NAD(P)-binding domain-containing protein [Ohtaekwangia sp.]|uniref:NAD(P)-binding domain-containing protein n=1 Tax=Ohtaekwangia sp. TaxID=2066019 RepID=UPI002FDD6B83